MFSAARAGLSSDHYPVFSPCKRRGLLPEFVKSVLSKTIQKNLRRWSLTSTIFLKLLWAYHRSLYRLMRSRQLRLHQRGKGPIAGKILRCGIVTVPWQSVFGEDAENSLLFRELSIEAERHRSSALSPNALDWKSEYLKRAYKPGQQIVGSALSAFMESPQLVSVLQDFFGGPYKNFAADYWHTVPANIPPTASQNWHSDPEDTIMCKVFIYFSDVDLDAGATAYILGSQVGGDQSLRPFDVPGTSGRYYSSSEMAELLSRDGTTESFAIGPRGTIVFINTTGIHRGGRGSKDRLMANLTFVSPRCPLPARWDT